MSIQFKREGNVVHNEPNITFLMLLIVENIGIIIIVYIAITLDVQMDDGELTVQPVQK